MVRIFDWFTIGFVLIPIEHLSGGYCKEYVKGKRPVGVMLDDTWFLKYAQFLHPSFPFPSHPSILHTQNPESQTELFLSFPFQTHSRNTARIRRSVHQKSRLHLQPAVREMGTPETFHYGLCAVVEVGVYHGLMGCEEYGGVVRGCDG